MERTWVMVGSLASLVMVAAGAFGAHALREVLDPDLLVVFETGTRYGTTHALALLVLGVLMIHHPSRRLGLAARFMALGIVVFTGSLWVLALTGLRWMGAITPIGGLSFLVGWGLVAWAAFRELGSPAGPKGASNA
ncbi:MAG: DUF423 domain-containing protein [Myxococcota bacterium]|nr:DUF423 domain-containing protein [Myxococcota bacterium]